MGTKPQIITLGSIVKEEIVKTLEINIIPHTMVLEIMEPFPGYHGKNLPSETVPSSFFLITSKAYSDEEILRLSDKISEKCNFSISATPAVVTVYHDHYPAIRIWHLESYEYIPELQECFRKEGIEFRKKKNIKDVALLHIRKHFYLEEMKEGIFKDLDTSRMFYLQIPQVSWNVFEKISKNIKNNLDNQNFDAALGMFFLRKVIDVVRLYGKEMDITYLMMLREKYIHEIERFFV